MQMDARLLKKSLEKIQCQDPKLVLMEIGEGHRFLGSRMVEHLTNGGPPPSDFLWWEKAFVNKP